MPLPDTLPELQIAGYRHDGVGRCSRCDARMEWFVTPKGRRMPFSLKPGTETKYQAHFASCPFASHFRKKK